MIAYYLSNQDLGNLDRSSRHFHFIFSQYKRGALRKRKIEQLLEPLLLHVVRGEEEKAAEILLKNPELVLEAGTVTDYSGRKEEGTPFQIAIRAGDEIMAEKIIEIYLETAPDDETKQERQEQLDEQFNVVFPNGYARHLEDQERSANEFERDVLNPLIAAFDDATIDDLQAALEKRYNDSLLCRKLQEFKDKFHELSRQEKVYNPHHLLKVFEKYNAKFNEWCGIFPDNAWSHLDLFWRQVIGWEERYLPANYAQAFCTGLSNMVKGHRPLERTLRLYNFDTNQELNFFPQVNASILFFDNIEKLINDGAMITF